MLYRTAVPSGSIQQLPAASSNTSGVRQPVYRGDGGGGGAARRRDRSRSSAPVLRYIIII